MPFSQGSKVTFLTSFLDTAMSTPPSEQAATLEKSMWQGTKGGLWPPVTKERTAHRDPANNLDSLPSLALRQSCPANAWLLVQPWLRGLGWAEVPFSTHRNCKISNACGFSASKLWSNPLLGNGWWKMNNRARHYTAQDLQAIWSLWQLLSSDTQREEHSCVKARSELRTWPCPLPASSCPVSWHPPAHVLGWRNPICFFLRTSVQCQLKTASMCGHLRLPWLTLLMSSWT